jgi:hypothetical protein
MNYINVLVCLFFGCFFMACSSSTEAGYEMPEYAQRACMLRAKAAQALSDRHEMNQIGTAGGMIDSVRMVGAGFQKVGSLSKDELRKIIVDCVDEFLVVFNEDEEIRSDLQNYPFESKNIEINIFVMTSDRGFVYYPDICTASFANGEISFRTHIKVDGDEIGRYETDSEETYEEALSIVRGDG